MADDVLTHTRVPWWFSHELFKCCFARDCNFYTFMLHNLRNSVMLGMMFLCYRDTHITAILFAVFIYVMFRPILYLTAACAICSVSTCISPNSVRLNLLKTCLKPSFQQFPWTFRFTTRLQTFGRKQVLSKIEEINLKTTNADFSEQLTNRNAGSDK